MSNKIQLQYELWRECNCKCTFCTLGDENLYTPEKLKLQSVETAINELQVIDTEKYDTVGFIGGEFFQGQLNTQRLKDKFFELFRLCNQLLNDNKIESVWINASLLIGNQKDLYDVLDLFDKKEKVWVLTSYDVLGRFHSNKMKETWEFHMKKLHEEYPEVHLNTTMILTGSLIDMYLNDEINFEEFKEKYHTGLFLKNPIPPHGFNDADGEPLSNEGVNKILGNFFPTRKKAIAFFMKYKMKESELDFKNLLNMDLRAQELRKNFNDRKHNHRNVVFIRKKDGKEEYTMNKSRRHFGRKLQCGHPEIYNSYCDCRECILCDKERMKDI